MEDWAEIRRLYRAEGMGIKAIARHMRVARNTVREAVRSDIPPRYERERKGSIVDAVEPDILALLREFPTMPATVIAERIGWPYSDPGPARPGGGAAAVVRAARSVPADVYRPGELGQFDLWQPEIPIPVGFGQADKLWVVVGAMAFSRFLAGWMIPSRESHDVLGGHLEVLRQFRAVPRCAVWDQEGAIGQWHGPRMVFTEAFQAFRGTLGMGARLCLPTIPRPRGSSNATTATWRPASCPAGASRT